MSPAVETLLAALRAAGIEPRRCGSGWTARCPAHDDDNPSLSIAQGDGGRPLAFCHAGCEYAAVIASVGLKPSDLMPEGTKHPARASSGNRDRLRLSVKSSTPAAPNAPRSYPTAAKAVAALAKYHGTPTAWWKYVNRNGEPVSAVVRWNHPPDPDKPGKKPGKTVLPISVHDGKWFVKGMPEPRPLYRLPSLLALPPGSTVYVVEGEKKADLLHKLGLHATTSSHGANSALKTDWSPLKGMHVVLLPDHDVAGDGYEEDVAGLVTTAGAYSVRAVRLADAPNLARPFPEGGDIADFMDIRGGEPAAIRREIEGFAQVAEPIRSAPRHGGAVMVRMSDVKPESLKWLWEKRIAFGKLTVMVGDPGLGKSAAAIDIVARLTQGKPLPLEVGMNRGPVGAVLLTAEDDLADTVSPRLTAAGADMSRVIALKAVSQVDPKSGTVSDRPFNLQRDIPALIDAIESLENCGVVIIDPVTAYLGTTNSYNNAEVRALLAPLTALAAKYGLAIILITHMNKDSEGPAMYRASGSLAFVAAARTAFLVVQDAKDMTRRLFLPLKTNVSGDKSGLAFRVEKAQHIDTAVVVWETATVAITPDEALGLLRKPARPQHRRDDAKQWLLGFLSNGPRSAVEVENGAEEAGIALATLSRAKNDLNIRSDKTGYDGGWIWALPPDGEQLLLEDDHQAQVDPLRVEQGENGTHAPKAITSGQVRPDGHVGSSNGEVSA